MSASLDGKLVVAISSRALFDFEQENEVFEQGDDRAYMALQLERLEVPAKPGVAFSLIKKLLAFNQTAADSPDQPGSQPVEVVILSRNDPVSGMRVFRSAQHYGLPIQRGSFTRGQSPWRYLKPLHANLFLSTHLSDVRAALEAGVPAAQVYPQSVHAGNAYPHEVRIAFDGDAVLFSDEAERVYQAEGLSAFQKHETDKAQQPLLAGPFKPLLAALQRLQQAGTPTMRIRTALVTARPMSVPFAPSWTGTSRSMRPCFWAACPKASFCGNLSRTSFLTTRRGTWTRPRFTSPLAMSPAACATLKRLPGWLCKSR